ncbi:amino acid transporter [Actinomycetospora sp. TBRC 11914]|uniref:amino acid transporter n=1 Tax=Actinomycetospora sp. TBRC 11914 TaxID=2729387 RepID=UPI00145EF8F0|nr:amino acid transporter [Actinomycetospora sp. TBRC 11914]NMO89999.1 amino acid transporter [Actinomycetospora sp. TBRC 11914]
MTDTSTRPAALRRWLLEGLVDRSSRHTGPGVRGPDPTEGKPWWRVMCLTGVDYFSTLGYQPAVAVAAAGLVSPIATIVLVALTLLGALPIYRRVARESPRGEGSVAMLERLLSYWWSKLLVLVLLGFAATDFVITITLSAADASAHVVENPLVGGALSGWEVPLTIGLILLLGAVFLAGFHEAIGIAVVIVGVYLVMNLVVVVGALVRIATAPQLVVDWGAALTQSHGGNVFAIIGIALLVFPKLALGLSGFETGVTVMPLIRGAEGDTERSPEGRIAGARKLLTTAALIMSAFLVTSSFACTVLIPLPAFAPDGPANGRALAYLAHEQFGDVIGTAYDLSTIVILWFAGASAMAGLLNLVPRYLPRYGMAPDWARAVRPMVVVFTLIGIVVTVIFDASVDAQSGAYATGVLVLITSASIAVTLSARKHGQRAAFAGFAVVSVVFVYTTVTNMVERPEGLKIGLIFVVAIMVVSFASRAARSFELRITAVHLDAEADAVLREAHTEDPESTIRLIANEPDRRDHAEYHDKELEERYDHHIPSGDALIFVEITVGDPSDFEEELHVHGEHRHGYRILRARAASVPNAIAALLLELRDRTGRVPHVYFEWTEGNPAINLVRYLLFGVGEVAPVAREVLREAEPDPARRPAVHVG